MKRTAILLLIVICGLGMAAQAADPFLVMRASTPLIVSGAAGLRFSQPTGHLRPAIQAEAGIGGGKLAFGWDNTGEARMGYALKAAFLQTWIAPIEVDTAQSFVGLEVEYSIRKLLLNLGGYRRVSSGDDDWLAAAGLGFLF